MRISVPDFSMVVLIGASGSGKSTFARQHFLSSEILSSDACRAWVSDDENDQTVSQEAFDVLHFILGQRLKLRRLTVIDATNVQPESRSNLLKVARQYHCLPVAIVLDIPESICLERNESRPDRAFGKHVISRQRRELRGSLRNLQREGFRHIFTLKTPEQVSESSIVREPLYNDKRGELGPFDIIGDVHGCYDELVELLVSLGYQVQENGVIPPDGRKAVFVGDLVDRGPKIPQVLRLVMGMVAEGSALCVPGNHDMKLLRALKGKNVQITHGLDKSLAQLAEEPAEFRQQAATFLDSLISHYVLDGGSLVVAHAGMKAEMQGRGSGAVREFALFGETTGETDEFGLPVRYNWAADYRGDSMVVYGHTPIPEPEWINRTINIDTGCVFGGSLTALRYPEQELVSVPAHYTYAEPIKPLLVDSAPHFSGQQQLDDVLDISDVIGKRLISTRYMANITIRETHVTPALEVISRFAVDPHWLIYLPPTMSPCETSLREDYLEHPEQAFDYFRYQGISQVVCQEKHMGSRAVVILCQDVEAARQRFGVKEDRLGICYTRTGRNFFNDPDLEQTFLTRLHESLTAGEVWEQFNTSWIALDCELMPWSAKAQELLQRQYAAVGSSAQAALRMALDILPQGHSPEMQALIGRFQTRADNIGDYQAAYRRYCWDVNSIDELRLAPFHILATEKAVHSDKTHLWHMEALHQLAQADSRLLYPTQYQVVEVSDPDSLAAGVAWWEQLTASGGEGMVVKPMDFITKNQRRMVQPAVKCRGREYLRIIYGPEYTSHLEALRKRGLNGKRSLALREFALGIEGLQRFVAREPLRRVHECAFGVLALESEPIDPRL